ncbi:charged multivesicular body protein 3-like isoform X1 [Penaeus chinensis]|uniref:charged multivesicular body protein 3-like isoform X1 n=1 Tax=Penaeus chinensis TaxID=139456 RepID=UPI001FB60D8B|nr:charged multivesicular body protein 3-like isoform X1 [Penaeus chinensis]XP_047489209.1 charged multivesicular body protein 3-like isoform X1 [Penaeus chinensis]
MGLFSKSPSKSPKDQVNEWCSRIRKEGYGLDRQIRTIQREEEKVKRSLKEAAKKGDKDVCRMLAKELVQSRKAVARIYTTKAHLNSVQSQMKTQLATLRVAGSLQQSTEVMKTMQQLVKLPDISRTMQDMSREMMKAGIIEEMLEDTMESMEPEELEEEAQEEIDKVLWEITAGELGKAPATVSDALPSEPTGAEALPQDSEEEAEEDMEEMRTRLEALRS